MKDKMTYLEDEQQLRSRWQSLNDRFDRLERRLTTVRLDSVESSKMRLIRQQRFIPLLSAFAMMLCYPLHHQFNMPLWIVICFIVFFLVMTFKSIRLRKMLMSLSISELSVADALQQVYRITRYRRYSQILGISMALPLVACMFWYFRSISESIFFGGVAGLVIGGILGLKADREARSWLRNMRHELESLADDNNEH